MIRVFATGMVFLAAGLGSARSFAADHEQRVRGIQENDLRNLLGNYELVSENGSDHCEKNFALQNVSSGTLRVFTPYAEIGTSSTPDWSEWHRGSGYYTELRHVNYVGGDGYVTYAQQFRTLDPFLALIPELSATLANRVSIKRMGDYLHLYRAWQFVLSHDESLHTQNCRYRIARESATGIIRDPSVSNGDSLKDPGRNSNAISGAKPRHWMNYTLPSLSKN